MIAVVDYSCGNTHAFINAFKYLNVDSVVASTIDEIENADKIILPGVGHFKKAMDNFLSLDIVDALNECVMIKKKPVLVWMCLYFRIFF